MKFQNALAVCVFTPLMFVIGGCSIFDSTNKKKDNNVAYFIAPEIASDGASIRKKPAQPKQTFEEIEPEDCLLKEAHALESAYGVYVVQQRDTIYGIARKAKMSPVTLMAINGLDRTSKLIVGQRLKIENNKIPPRKLSEASVKTSVYTVQAGDSLSKIAHMYGITIKSLKETNNLSSDKLVIGQKLAIPESKATPKDLNANLAKSQRVLDNGGKYVVKPGDNLTLISKHFGVKQSVLQEANNIDNPNKLRVGQKLIIPSATALFQEQTSSIKLRKNNILVPSHQNPYANSSNDLYVIKSGDTVDKIARELGVEKVDLVKLNNLGDGSSLQEGKKLLVPQKKATIEQNSPVSNSVSTSKGEDFFENFDEIPVIEIKN
ncbi:MAG: LysM peptidoglycan-binding domain-containing protein [Puniceicoccales bacterium]|jgi:LysM repeat protein|nr:LysM peptidoglycan-binding domain-containing protein [Puniceicoccales bacterium]